MSPAGSLAKSCSTTCQVTCSNEGCNWKGDHRILRRHQESCSHGRLWAQPAGDTQLDREVDVIGTEIPAVEAGKAACKSEREQLQADRAQWEAERQEWRAKEAKWREEWRRWAARQAEWEAERRQLKEELNQVSDRHSCLCSSCS